MLTVWWDVEVGRSVVVQFTRVWFCWYVVEMFTSCVTGACHTTAHRFRSSRHPLRHTGTRWWRIQRAQSCSVRRSCHQFHSLVVSCISRQRHYAQPRNYRQNVYWRHFFCLRRQRQRSVLLILFAATSFTKLSLNAICRSVTGVTYWFWYSAPCWPQTTMSKSSFVTCVMDGIAEISQLPAGHCLRVRHQWSTLVQLVDELIC